MTHTKHSYIGDPDFHDGTLTEFCHENGIAVAQVRGCSGRLFQVTFVGVARVDAVQPIGMMLYGLAELPCDPPFRKFIFLNWEEEGTASLEITAENLNIKENGV